MVLEDELAAQRARSHARWSPQERSVREDAVAAVARSGLVDGALGVGQRIPPITLPDATGRVVQVETLLRQGPVVISFYRGGWCPYCSLELYALQRRLPEIRELSAGLVAISPELPDRSLSAIAKHGLEFPVLSDGGNFVARAFGLAHPIDPRVVAYQIRNGNDVAAFNGEPAAEVPLPATYVVDTEGIIRFAFVDADYTRRAEPADVIAAIRNLGTAGNASAAR